MKVVISGYYGFNNSGDDALLLSIIQEIRSIDEGIDITVLSASPEQTKKKYGVNAIYRYNIFSVIYNILRCNLLISGGGTLIQDATSTKSLFYYLSVIRLAKIFKRKVMLYANGIGPLNSFRNIERTKDVLNDVDLITLRDEKSAFELTHIGVTRPQTELTADPAFLLEPDDSGLEILESYSIPKDRPLMCVSMRDWIKNPENFVSEMSKFCDFAHNKYGFFTVFLPMQHSVDYKIALSVKNAMKNRSVIIGTQYPTESVLSLMQEMNICVGMRLHTLIYSASCTVPTIGIVYDPKISGVMEYMGEDKLISVEDFSADKMALILDDVCQNYDAIKSSLKYNMQNLKVKAKENGELMKKLLYGGSI